MSSLEEAVTQVTQFLGMHPCDRSDRIPEGKSAHTLYLAGKTFLLVRYMQNVSFAFIHRCAFIVF